MATKLEVARIQLVLQHPFFGSLVMRREIEETDRIPTAAVDKTGKIMVNPKFVANLSVDECVFMLAHETMHVVYAHLPRLQGRNPEVWNIACDATINEMLVNCKVGEFLKGGVRMPGADQRTADSIYNELMQKQPPRHGDEHGQPGDPGEPGGQPGHGQQGQPGNSPATGKAWVKDILPEEANGLSSSDTAEAEAKGKIEIAQAAQAARMQGKLGSYLGGLVGQILESKMPWYELLEKFMAGRPERHQIWNRPNKRFLSSGFYLPRRQRMPSMGKLVVGIDTSGSIGDKEMGAFLGHLNRIVEQCNPETVDVLYVTHKVAHVEHVERGEDIPMPKRRWSGGTDMCEVVRWIEDNDVDADVAVIFTDGYTDYPKDSPCDLLWVLTEKVGHAGAYGEFIQMEE